MMLRAPLLLALLLALAGRAAAGTRCICIVPCPPCRDCNDCDCPPSPDCPKPVSCPRNNVCPARCPKPEACPTCEDCTCPAVEACPKCPPKTSDLDDSKVSERPVGYKRYDFGKNQTGWYKFHLEPLTWMQGKRACHRDGAHLMTINSLDEGKLARQMIEEYGMKGEYLHIGFHNMLNTEWTLVTGEFLAETGYEHWEPGQPDNVLGIEACGAITEYGYYHDISCDSLILNFICEWEEESSEGKL